MDWWARYERVFIFRRIKTKIKSTIYLSGNEKKLPFETTIEQGASTTVWAAVAPELENNGGLYLDDNRIGVKKASMQEVYSDFTGLFSFWSKYFMFYLFLNIFLRMNTGYLDYILNDEYSDKLWELTEKLVPE